MCPSNCLHPSITIVYSNYINIAYQYETKIIHTITQVSLSRSLSLNLSLTPLPLLPIFSEFFPPSIPFLLSLCLSHGHSHKVSSFSQQSSPSYRPPTLPLPPPSDSHMAISFPFPPTAFSLYIYLPSPPHSHMASWFSQDIADSSSSSDSLLEGGDEAHE